MQKLLSVTPPNASNLAFSCSRTTGIDTPEEFTLISMFLDILGGNGGELEPFWAFLDPLLSYLMFFMCLVKIKWIVCTSKLENIQPQKTEKGYL